MDSFPLFIRLHDRPVLIVGGGEIACHKARMLSQAAPRLTLVAPRLHPATATLLQSLNCTHHARSYQPTDLAGAALVIAATDDEALNAQIAAAADAAGILVNAVDMPGIGNVTFPSIVDRSPLVIAVGSGGRAPVLVRLLRARLETLIPASYGTLAELVGTLRQRVKKLLPNLDLRRRFWDHHLQGQAADQALSGDLAGAKQTLNNALKQLNPNSPQRQELERGEVYLVGAGPGDPDLLTFRALRLMQQADVVLYDRLVAKPVLDLVRREAERIYVGKDRNPYSITQENINQALLDQARAGKRVLRLKGGDPFIFGRGGEELESLAAAQIPFQVVPGITAASGCAAYAGIPLTHRDHCQSVRFITGHHRNGKLDLPWKELVSPSQTLVFYMGLNGLEEICHRLQEHGLDPKMPAALIEKGTAPHQRIFATTLANLPQKVRQANAKAPTLIIIGTVVTLHKKLTPPKNPP